MRSLRSLILSSLFLVLAGCATWGPGGAPHPHSAGYTVTVPSGWIFHPSISGELLATREGLVLQRLAIRRIQLPYTLPRSKRVLTKDLTPYEIAENLTDEGKADRGLARFGATAQAAIRLDGLDGVRLDHTHATEEGLRLSTRRWAVVRGDTLWLATYVAPTRHYFERDLSAITTAVEAVRFDAAKP